MQRKPLKMLGGAIATAIVALMLIGCRGATGQTGAAGANGANGSNGSNGSNGTNGATYVVDAATLTPDEWSGLTLKGQITGVTMGTAPVVNFKMTDGHNVPVKGLGFAGKGSSDAYTVNLNMAFSVAKLIPASATTGAPSRWVSYIVTSNPTVAAPTTWNPARPTTDNIGTLVDNGDGTYRYTFRRDISQTKAQVDAYTYTGSNLKADLDDLTYDPTLTHRITGYVGGTAWGTGSNNATRTATGFVAVPILNPANFLYDFVPSTGAPVTSANEQREITSVDKCFGCHAKFEFHGGGRQDTRYCVVCHNDQRKYGRAEATIAGTTVSGESGKFRGRATGDLPSFIHRLHMGEELKLSGYAYGGLNFNEVTYPQDHRNCVKCHTASTATPQGDNWWKKPNRMACGGCHDNVDFATGSGHGDGGQQLNDQNCVNCHTEAYVKLNHIPIVPPNPANIYLGGTVGTNNNTNAAFIAAYNGQTANGTPTNLPAGAKKPTWEISSITLNSSAKAVIKFRILLDGVPQVLNTYSATGKTEMMDGFVGGPSVYVAFTVPYDGITYPADWNATFSTYLKNIWRGDGKAMDGTTLAASAKGTLTGPDATSTAWYTLTFTDAVIPTTASMVTAGIGYTYGLGLTQPLTQISGVAGFPWAPDFYAYNVEGKKQGGLLVPAPNVIKALTGALPTGFPAPTPATSTVPYATGPAHETRRVIVSTQKCNDCHGALGVFTAKAYHAGQRNDAPTCEFCHNGQRVNAGWGVNTKDFVHALHGAGKRVNKFSWESGAGNKYWTITYPGVLNNCEACHLPGTYDFKIPANANEVPNLNWTTVATGTVPNPVPVIVTGDEPVSSGGVTYWSPFVTAGAAYGSGFSYSAITGAITQAAGTTLVNSPYVAACSNCHDTDMALNHMKANGGSFYVPRSSVQNATGALVNKEQCFLCHSSGKIADVQMVHMSFK